MVRLWRDCSGAAASLQLTQDSTHLKSPGTVLPVGLWGGREYLDVVGRGYRTGRIMFSAAAFAPPGLDPPGPEAGTKITVADAVIDTSIYRFKYYKSGN